MTELGDYLKQRRGDISLREFAKRIGISHTHLDSIEKGYDYRSKKAVSISLETIEKIADGLNLDIHQVVAMATGRKQPLPNQPEKPDTSPKETALAERLKNASPDTQKAIDLLLNADEISTKSDKKVTPFA